MPWYALRDYSNNRRLGWKFLVKHRNNPSLAIEEIASPEEVTVINRSSGVHLRTVQLTPGYVYVKLPDITPLAELIRLLPYLNKQVPARDIVEIQGNDEKRLEDMLAKHKQTKPSSEISVGDKVTITAGAFESYTGEVEQVSKHKVTVVCMVFDRSTPLEIDLRHLVKIAD